MSTAGPVFCIALSLLGVRSHYRALTVLFVSTGKFVTKYTGLLSGGFENCA